MLGLWLQDSVAYQEIKAEGYEEGRQEGLQEGRQEGLQEGRQAALAQEKALVLRLLRRKVGSLTPAIENDLATLSFPQIEDLGEALLEFTSVADAEGWLEELRSHTQTTLHTLTQRCGPLDEPLTASVSALPFGQLTALTAATDTVNTLEDLRQWVQSHSLALGEPG